MSAVLAAVLAAACVACLLGLPSPASLRLGDVVPLRGSVRDGARVAAVPVIAVAALVAGAAVGPVVAALGAGAAVAVLQVRRRSAVRAARTQERARAVEACAALSAELRAGRTPPDALLVAAEVASGPFRASLWSAAGAARLGGEVPAALHPPPSTAVPEVLRALAACWAVCAATGSGLASAVERLEEGLRADQAQRRAVAAELAGPRATAGLLALLPVGGLLMAGGLGADPLHVLLATPLGLVCLTAGLLLDGLGLWWTARLVDRAAGSA